MPREWTRQTDLNVITVVSNERCFNHGRLNVWWNETYVPSASMMLGISSQVTIGNCPKTVNEWDVWGLWECFVLAIVHYIQCILELKLLEMWSIRSQQSLYGMHPHSKNHNRPALPWDKSPFPSSSQDHQSVYHSHDLCNPHALPPHHLYIFLLFVWHLLIAVLQSGVYKTIDNFLSDCIWKTWHITLDLQFLCNTVCMFRLFQGIGQNCIITRDPPPPTQVSWVLNSSFVVLNPQCHTSGDGKTFLALMKRHCNLKGTTVR